MKDYIVEAGYVSLSSGTIKLTEKQYRKREYALKETKVKGIYDIIAKTGFKRGEVFSSGDDMTALLKSGMIVNASDAVKAAEKDEYLELVIEMDDKQFAAIAKELKVDIAKLKRDEANKLIAEAMKAADKK